MNLTEFIEQNNVACRDDEDFAHSPEFYKIRQFEQTVHTIRGVPFLEPETYRVREFDVTLRGCVQEKWDKHEKKNGRLFFVDRVFHYPGLPEGMESIEDAVPAGQSIDEALAALEADRDRFEFFQRYDLIDAGQYWLNRDLKRCLVVDGQVVVMGSGVH
jgi:hypothetical protein